MIGQTLGHYIVREKIGAGGMGEVYRARDQHLERDVALKILPTGFLANDAARKRLRREALALSKLNHPNIATVFDFDTQGNVDFLAMKLIQWKVRYLTCRPSNCGASPQTLAATFTRQELCSMKWRRANDRFLTLRTPN